MSNQSSGGGSIEKLAMSVKQPIKKVVSQAHNVGQKPLHKIVLLPSQSIGHSRQNSTGSASVGGASNGSLGTFQDSLNSFGLANTAAAGVHSNQGTVNQIFFGKQITLASNPQSTIQSARGQQPHLQSTQLSASVSSSTETLLKPGMHFQSKAMISAQSTAEKQKPVFFQHFKKGSTDQTQNGSSTLKPQTLYMQHQRNSSGSSSSGSSGRENKPPIYNQSTSQLIHIQQQRGGNLPANNYSHGHSQSTQLTNNAPSNAPVQVSQQQMKLQKYNKMKTELSTQSQQKRISPINGGPPPLSHQNQVQLGKKPSHESMPMSATRLTEVLNQDLGGHQGHQNLGITQSLLYQKVSGQVKGSISSVAQSQEQTPQVNSQKVGTNTNPNAKGIILKTSQMTKNLLMSSNQNHLAQNLGAQTNQTQLKDQQKAQTLKLTVNNLLNSKMANPHGGTSGGDLSARLILKAQSINHHLQKAVPSQFPSRQVVNSGSNSGAFPNDSLKTGSFNGLTQHKGHQQSVQIAMVKPTLSKTNLSSALTTSKMMMALHKKCNSIVTTPISSANQGAFIFQPNKLQEKNQDQEENKLETNAADADRYVNPEPPSTVKHSNQQHFQLPSQQQQQQQQQNNLISSTSTVLLSMTTSQMSQPVEFFDENVQINQIRQITPRGQLYEGYENPRKGAPSTNPQVIFQNFFDKTRPLSKGMASSNLVSGQISAGVQSPLHHPSNEHINFNIRPEAIQQPNPSHKRNSSMMNAADQEMQVEIVDRRRMSYENKRLSLSKVQIPQSSGQNSLERQPLVPVEKTPVQEKRSVGPTGPKSGSQDLSHQLAQAHEEFSNRKLARKQAKEDIVQSIGLILRQQKGLSIDDELLKKDPTHHLTLQHLRDFLTYLEDKNIINCESLAKNDHEMQNLINDLVKLDFNKFQGPMLTPINPTPPIQVSISKKKRMSQETQQNRRASLDLIKDRQPGLLSPPDEDGSKIPFAGPQSNVMSPLQPRLLQQKSDNIKSVPFPNQNLDGNDGYMCFYSPINLNGNGNIVNTNIQIFQPPSTSQFNLNSNPIPTAQKLNYIGTHKVFSQPVSQLPSSEKEPLINHAHDKIPRVKAPNFNHAQIQNPNVPSFQPNQLIFVAPQQAQGQKKSHKRVYSIGSNHDLENQRVNLNNTPLGRPAMQQQANNQQPYNRMGFGFGGMPEQYQAGLRGSLPDPGAGVKNQQLFQDTDILDLGIQQVQVDIDHNRGAAQYHVRKRSMVVQKVYDGKDMMVVQPARQNMIVRDQHQRSQEHLIQALDEAICKPDEEAMLCSNKPRPNHRRAATNFISSVVANQEGIDIRTLQPLTDQYFTSRGGTLDQFISSDEIREERDKLIAYIKHFTYSIKPEIPITSVDYYKFVKLIGKGAFGKVTLGIHKLTGKVVAIKTVDKTLMKDDYQKKKVLQEVQILKKVRHANVIRLLEVFESPKHLLMVMEYAGGGDLLQFVKKRRRLDESEARRIFKQVVFGIAHCHCRSVLHRDIKLDNILLDKDGDVKICDFGVSRVIQKHQKISEQCGTPAYIAPEIISDGGYQGFAADIWSLGVLLFAMICGTVPFKAQSMHELHDLIINGRFDFPNSISSQLSCEVKDLVCRMLIVNPKERISISEILKHPWIQLFDSILDDNQEYQMDGDITLHSFDAQNALQHQMVAASGEIHKPAGINELLSSVNVDNLYKSGLNAKQRLSYSDYCSITQDHATMHINDEVLTQMEGEMGIPKKLVRDHLNRGDLNHATATYQLIVLS